MLLEEIMVSSSSPSSCSISSSSSSPETDIGMLYRFDTLQEIHSFEPFGSTYYDMVTICKTFM